MQFNLFKHPIILLKLVASVMYIIMGVLCGLNPRLVMNFYDGLPINFVYALAALLCIYGAYRLYRVIYEIRELTQVEEDTKHEEG
jgi:nitric oxide reductase large subunit